jgi:hypothetical protein
MRASLLVAAALLGAPTAQAEDPCAEDVKQFCAEVKPGGGRIEHCLRGAKQNVSLACRERLDAWDKKARSLLEEFSLACEVDIGRLCGEVKPGEGRVMACLVKREDELSSSCRSETDRFQAAREEVLAVRSACRADVDRLCKSVSAEAGPLVECLQTRRADLSAECRAAAPKLGTAAAEFIDAVDTLTSQEHVMGTLEILQGLDSVAFSRSQIAFQGENFQGLQGVANANRFTLNPQFVFGHRRQFAILVKVPVLTIFPYRAVVATASGVADITTGFGWSFYAREQIRQYLGLGLQWNTGTQAALGAPWALIPTYAIAVGLARWCSLTVELTWVKSFGSLGNYAELDLLYLRPILVFGLPANAFVALDTKLGWDLVNGSFVPVMKFAVGKFIDRGKSLSITAWYQASLTSESVWRTFPGSYKFSVGVGISYFFDW